MYVPGWLSNPTMYITQRIACAAQRSKSKRKTQTSRTGLICHGEVPPFTVTHYVPAELLHTLIKYVKKDSAATTDYFPLLKNLLDGQKIHCIPNKQTEHAAYGQEQGVSPQTGRTRRDGGEDEGLQTMFECFSAARQSSRASA